MSVHTPVSVVNPVTDLRGKRCLVTATLSAAYDAGGSLIDLSSANAVMLAGNGGFVTVSGVQVVAVSPHGSYRYFASFVPGASLGPALGKIKLQDTGVDPCAEPTGDLSATTVTLEVYGT